MANRLIELYTLSKACKNTSTFSEIREYDKCIRTLTEFQLETPKDNILYKEILAASDLSVKRIKIQKEIQYRSFNKEEDFLRLRTHRQVIYGQEVEAWNKLDTLRAEKIEKNIEKPNVLFNQDNISNLTLIIILFMFFFIYRLISSSGFKKIKARNILKAFQLDHLAALIDKDAFTKRKYSIGRFGTKIDEEVKPEDILTALEQEKVSLIYLNIGVLEEAIRLDMKQNKFNLFVGIDLSIDKNRTALNTFLERINEKTLIKDN